MQIIQAYFSKLWLGGRYGSNTGCSNAPEQRFYFQSLSRKERLLFTARNQNRSIKYRDFGDIRLKK
jgi:hypothetical protein